MKMNKIKKERLSGAEIYSKYGMFIILVVIVIAAALLSKNFLKIANITNVFRQTSVVSIIAFGQTMILILGMIDLSQGSVMALTGCIACSVAASNNTSPSFVVLALLVGTLIGLVCGFVNGFVISTFKIPPFIMTLAMMKIARGIVLLYTNASPVVNMGEYFKQIGQANLGGFLPIPVLIMLVVMLIMWVILNRTKFGRYIFAVGGNEQAAVASGIKSKKIITLSYVVCGALTGFAGVILCSRMNSGQPAGAENYEFDAITGAIVGGTSLIGGIGSIVGTLIGCLIIGVLNNIMNLMNVSSYWQQIISGLVIALAVIADVTTKTKILNKKSKN